MGRALARRWAVLASILCHGALLGSVGLVGTRLDARQDGGERSDAEQVSRVQPESGDTFEIDEIIEDERGRGAPERSVSALPQPPPVSEPSPSPAPPPPPPSVPPPIPPAERASEPAAPEAKAPQPPVAPPAKPQPSPTSSAAAAAPPRGTRRLPEPDGIGHTEAEEGRGKGQRYGQSGPEAPRGFRLIAAAFTRAVPHAVSADPVWSELPLGLVGTVDLRLRIDAQGKIAAMSRPADTHEALEALIRRTMAAIRAGRFVLSNAGPSGTEVLRIEVRLEQREPLSGDRIKMWRELPSVGAPGHAYFTLRSGRHFDAKVTVLESVVAPEPSDPKDSEDLPDGAQPEGPDSGDRAPEGRGAEGPAPEGDEPGREGPAPKSSSEGSGPAPVD